jgi:hypothetical protein
MLTVQAPADDTFYLILQTMIDGAASRGLSRKDLALMLSPVVWPDDERYNTEQMAELCQRATSTLERWRCRGFGPEYFKDQLGRVYYTGKSWREFKELHQIPDA